MIREIFLIVTAIAFALSFYASPAEAALVPIAITAEVTGLRDDRGLLEGRINIGDLITGVYTYNSSTPDSDPREDFGIYEHHTPPYGVTLTVGGFVFMTDPDNVEFVVDITDDFGWIVGPLDGYGWASYNNLPLSNGVMPGRIGLAAEGSSRLLPSDALPTTAPDLSQWVRMDVFLWGAEGSKDFYIIGDVTSVALIPEPATIILLALGGLALLNKRKASRTKRKSLS